MLPNEAKGLVLTRRLSDYGCLNLYPQVVWNAEHDELRSKLNLKRKDHQEYYDYFMDGVCDFELDNADRFVIPKALLEALSSDKELIIRGMGDHITIWSKAEWEKRRVKKSDRFKKLNDDLAELFDKLS